MGHPGSTGPGSYSGENTVEAGGSGNASARLLSQSKVLRHEQFQQIPEGQPSRGMGRAALLLAARLAP